MSEQHAGRTAGPRAPRFGRAEQELATALLILGIALYARLNIESFITGRRGAGFVDPDFWPGWLLNVIIVSAGFYALQSWRKRSAGSDPSGIATVKERIDAKDEVEGLHEVAVSGSLVRLVLGFAILWAYIYSMTRVGFLPSTFVFSLVFLWFVGERRPVVLVAIPVTIVGAILGVFTRLLVVPLPRGTGVFLEFSTFFY